MKLSIPIQADGKTYIEAEIIKPSSGVLSDANKEKGNPYTAVKVLLSGCIVSLTESEGEVVEDKARIKSLANYIPYKTAEQLLFSVVQISNKDAAIEGVYKCPRCKKDLVCEKKDEDFDNRDYLQDMKVKIMELSSYDPIFNIDIEDPVKVVDKNDGELLLDPVSSMSFHWPTLRDCIVAHQNYAAKGGFEFTYAVCIQALEKVNGDDVDSKYKNRWGMSIFKNIPNPNDISRITSGMSTYGVDSTVEKSCPGCGKEWRVTIDTSDFFAEALRQGQ